MENFYLFFVRPLSLQQKANKQVPILSLIHRRARNDAKQDLVQIKTKFSKMHRVAVKEKMNQFLWTIPNVALNKDVSHTQYPTPNATHICRKGAHISDGKWKLCYRKNDNQTHRRNRLNIFFSFPNWQLVRDQEFAVQTHFVFCMIAQTFRQFHSTLLTWLAQLCDVFGCLRGEFCECVAV